MSHSGRASRKRSINTFAPAADSESVRGELRIGETIRSEGLLGTGTFEGRLIGEVDLNGTRAVRPTVKGTAGLLGTARWVIDPDDPVGAGFLVS